MILWNKFHVIARTAPKAKPKNVRPNSLTDSSSSKDSESMAIMGPKMTALGEMVFMMAQIRPARQKSPFSLQVEPIEIRMTMPIPVRTFPLNGTLRLCKKLPRTISEAAQIVPTMEALIHNSLSSYLVMRYSM